MYLTYDEYLNMGGTLDETTFNTLEYEARVKVDYYTFGRLQKDTQFPESVRRCMFKLIQCILTKAQAMASGTEATVTSQSNDGFSVTFNTLSADKALEAAKTDMLNIIDTYLTYTENEAGKRLLFRGRYADE